MAPLGGTSIVPCATFDVHQQDFEPLGDLFLCPFELWSPGSPKSCLRSWFGNGSDVNLAHAFGFSEDPPVMHCLQRGQQKPSNFVVCPKQYPLLAWQVPAKYPHFLSLRTLVTFWGSNVGVILNLLFVGANSLDR